MRLTKNMHSFSKLSVSCSSSQLSLVLAAAPKPQFKVAMYHLFFSECSLPLPRRKEVALYAGFHPTSLISVRIRDGEKEMLTSVQRHICSQPSCIQSSGLAVGKKQVLIAQSFEVWWWLEHVLKDSVTTTFIWKANYLLKGSLFICLLPLVLIHRERRGKLAYENTRCD